MQAQLGDEYTLFLLQNQQEEPVVRHVSILAVLITFLLADACSVSHECTVALLNIEPLGSEFGGKYLEIAE
jgi:hypothetical protein